jgi:hypothetical protein
VSYGTGRFCDGNENVDAGSAPRLRVVQLTNWGSPMGPLKKYLKIDLGKRGAFSEAEWVNAMSRATPFLTRLAATGARSMMPGATAVVYEDEKFFVISSSPSHHSNEAKNFSNQKR